jgi:hypothetical protein
MLKVCSGAGMTWKIIVVEPVRSWLHGLRRTDRATLLQIAAAIDALGEEGPGLGRPLVDRVKGSALANMKELRPGSSGATEVRLLFVFDPFRQAVFLVGGTYLHFTRSSGFLARSGARAPDGDGRCVVGGVTP